MVDPVSSAAVSLDVDDPVSELAVPGRNVVPDVLDVPDVPDSFAVPSVPSDMVPSPEIPLVGELEPPVVDMVPVLPSAALLFASVVAVGLGGRQPAASIDELSKNRRFSRRSE
jgi:hypothetical protein